MTSGEGMGTLSGTLLPKPERPAMTAIGSAVTASSQGAVSRVALRADLSRHEKQLSDCVNCASASTPEGKRNIQDLGAQISSLKAKLNVVPRASAAASVGEAKSATASSVVGSRIDVYA
jgi:hypothetical protein